MDNRLRFLYQLTAFDDGGTQEAKQTVRLESIRPSSKSGCESNVYIRVDKL